MSKSILESKIQAQLTTIVFRWSRLGLGTIWEALGLAGPDAADCPYNGAQTFREYEALSGCDTGFVPLELVAGPGSRCNHWAEFCFGSELMTPFASTSC